MPWLALSDLYSLHRAVVDAKSVWVHRDGSVRDAHPAPSELVLPLWAQLSAVIGFLGAGIGVVRNAWKAEPKPPEGHQDAVVISGAFADAQPLRDLVAAVRESTSASRESADAKARFDRSQAERSRELLGAMEDLSRGQRSTTDELKAIKEVVTRGVRIVPAAPEPPPA